MSDLTGTPVYQDHVRQLETTDPAHPATFNPINQHLIDNDVYLKARSDAAGLFSDGFMPVAGSTVYTYDTQGRVDTVVHKDDGDVIIATITLVYDDANGGRVDYLEAVIARPPVQTIRETINYDGNNRITGSTRTIS